MAGDAQLGGLDPAQEISANGLDLFAVGAALIKLEQFFSPAAAFPHIHCIIHHHIIAAEHAVHLVVADVGQLFVLVGLTVHSLFDQLTGQDLRRALIVAAVGQIDIGLSVLGHRHTLTDITGSGAERICHREPVAAGKGYAHAVTQLRQLFLIHQEVGKGEIKEFAQYVLGVALSGGE